MNGCRFSKDEVAALCRYYGPLVHLKGISGLHGEELDGAQLMWAFALNESYHEPKDKVPPDFFLCPPRFEPAYFTGRYASGTYQSELNTRFGQDGAKSYGCWQVMLCNTGFKPEEFERCEIGAQAFLGHMNRMIADQKPDRISQIADSYNSGNFKDFSVPDAYIKRLIEHYYQVPLPKEEAAQAVTA